MLKIFITVNPNKDKELTNTLVLLDLLIKYPNVKILIKFELTYMRTIIFIWLLSNFCGLILFPL